MHMCVRVRVRVRVCMCERMGACICVCTFVCLCLREERVRPPSPVLPHVKADNEQTAGTRQALFTIPLVTMLEVTICFNIKLCNL